MEEVSRLLELQSGVIARRRLLEHWGLALTAS
jgi:hypothetical protein